MSWQTKTLSAAFVVMLSTPLVGCQEKAEEPKKTASAVPSSAGATPGTTTNTSTDDTLCKDLQANAAVVKAHSAFITDICGGTKLADLRKAERVYNGGEAKIMDNSKELSTNRSEMMLYTSNVYATTAESYYKLQRLQMFKPDDFKEAGFEGDDNIKYEVTSQSENTVSFNYINDSDKAVVVDYNAKTTFYELTSTAPGMKRYVVGTKLTKSKETLIELEGMVIINEYLPSVGGNAAAEKVAEVFTLSRQVYDNNNDHKTTLSKAKESIGAEQKRSFKNAAKSKTHFAGKK